MFHLVLLWRCRSVGKASVLQRSREPLQLNWRGVGVKKICRENHCHAICEATAELSARYWTKKLFHLAINGTASQTKLDFAERTVALTLLQCLFLFCNCPCGSKKMKVLSLLRFPRTWQRCRRFNGLLFQTSLHSNKLGWSEDICQLIYCLRNLVFEKQSPSWHQVLPWMIADYQHQLAKRFVGGTMTICRICQVRHSTNKPPASLLARIPFWEPLIFSKVGCGLYCQSQLITIKTFFAENVAKIDNPSLSVWNGKIDNRVDVTLILVKYLRVTFYWKFFRSFNETEDTQVKLTFVARRAKICKKTGASLHSLVKNVIKVVFSECNVIEATVTTLWEVACQEKWV